MNRKLVVLTLRASETGVVTEVKEIPNTVMAFYKLMKSDEIYCARRTIGGKTFRVICDWEEYRKEYGSADKPYFPPFVGKNIVCGWSDERFVDLTESDVEMILEKIALTPKRKRYGLRLTE